MNIINWSTAILSSNPILLHWPMTGILILKYVWHILYKLLLLYIINLYHSSTLWQVPCSVIWALLTYSILDIEAVWLPIKVFLYMIKQSKCIHVQYLHAWDPYLFLYYACVHLNSLIIQSEIIQQVTFAIIIPSVQRMFNKLVTKSLQPWASKAFCTWIREVNWCNSRLYITFGSLIMLIIKLEGVQTMSVDFQLHSMELALL